MTEITMYCLCHYLKENKHSQFLQKNLMCGAVGYDQEYKSYLNNNNFILDSTHINISHLNAYFGQLTGLYWVWKNSIDEIIGTNTYRIFWDDQLKFSSNKLYVPCMNLKTQSMYTQYLESYGTRSNINGLNLMHFVSQFNTTLLSHKMLRSAYSQQTLYPFLMFISEHSIFDRLCEILFDIIFVVWDRYPEYCLEVMKSINSTRVFDIIGERVLTAIIMNYRYFISKKIEIVNSNVYQYNHDPYSNFKLSN